MLKSRKITLNLKCNYKHKRQQKYCVCGEVYFPLESNLPSWLLQSSSLCNPLYQWERCILWNILLSVLVLSGSKKKVNLWLQALKYGFELALLLSDRVRGMPVIYRSCLMLALDQNNSSKHMGRRHCKSCRLRRLPISVNPVWLHKFHS